MNDPKEIRLGAVSYLNARPLLVTLPFQIHEDVPSHLMDLFKDGEVDAALLSIYDIFQLLEEGAAEIVPHIGIGCRGPVYSVFLAYEGELKNIQQIQLDPSSHTSNKLLKIILAEFYHLMPEYLEEENVSATHLPRLIIGDPAIAFRADATCSILDLGEEWQRFTKLPFVFAMWCLRSNNTQKEYLSARLLQAKKEGLLLREKIAATHANPPLALRYLTDYIRYDVGPEELQGLALFKSLLQKYRL